MSTITKQIDELFRPWDSLTSPGCALGIVHKGTLAYARGYGMANLELAVPITPTSVFYLASMSKQFMATAIALLAEAGQLALHDDIRTYVPEVPDYGVRITLEHLIRHTSGLRDYLELGFLAGKRIEDVWSEADFLQSVARQRALNFAPGTRHLYSNTGYVLLSLVVKRVTGQSLGAFAQEQIFAPLGMTQSVFKEHHQQLIPQRASGYSAAPAGAGFSNEYHNLQVAGDGGLYSSVADLARWDANFYANRLGQGGPTLIELLHTTAPLADGTPQSYAFGLGHDSYRGLPIVKHGGGLNGARTQMIRFGAQRCTIICLANLSSFEPETMIRQVADLYLADQLGAAATPAQAAPAPAAREPIPLDAAALHAYTGAYHSPELDVTYQLAVADSQLTLAYRGQAAIPLQATAVDQFQDAGDRTLHFTRTADDEVNGFALSNGRVWDVRFARIQG
ncbi:MAG: serine hydrolase domain-containing protein [Caldilineaceae bacterium]